MGKILLTADFHLGLYGRTDDILTAAKSIRNYARQHNIKYVFILGDLFHDKQSINVEVAQKTYDFFKETKNIYGQEWITFPGNHDMYYKYSWKSTTLHPFSDVCTVLEDIHRLELYGRRFWVVPFIALDKAYMNVIDEIDNDSKESDIILTHIGCIGAMYNLCFLMQEQRAINFDHRAAGQVFTGHFHCYQRAGVRTHYVGSPIPFSFDEGVVDHGFVVYDCDIGTHEFVDLRPLMKKDNLGQIIPPNMITIGTEQLKTLEQSEITGNCFRIVMDKPLIEDEIVQYRKLLTDSGAKQVKWLRIKDNLEPKKITGASRMETRELFKNYFEQDKNKGQYDPKLMEDLHSEITFEGDSLYTIENTSIE